MTNDIKNPLILEFSREHGIYLVNKVGDQSGSYVDLGVAKELLSGLNDIINQLRHTEEPFDNLVTAIKQAQQLINKHS